SIKAGSHYEGTTLSASDFNVTVNWTEGKAATYPTEDFTWTVNGVNNGSLNEGDNSVIITYNGIPSAAFNVVGAPAAAKDVVENTLQTKTSLSYHYSAADNIATDTLTKTFTGVSGQSYADWSGKVGTSGAIYAGNSYPTSNDKDYIQLRYNNDSGIVTTGSGGKAKTVTVSWNGDTADGRTLNIYGKNSAYSSAADLHNEETRGTLIGTIVKGTSTSLSITSDYAYIGIKVNANSLYLDSIDIDWAGQPSYTFTNAYLGFGGSISKTLWNRLDSESTILGYGIMLATNSYLNGDSIKELYDLARYYEDNVDDTFEAVGGKSYSMVKGTSIKSFYNSVSTLPNESGSDYIWYLNKGLTCTNAGLTKGFTAVAFIRTADDEIVFLGEISKSAAQVAEDMINADPNDAIDENYLDGSLGYLAGLAS
ncbi:MAG: hypothetical protein J5666_00150, partial [Bacilli bacterium]|nr:hypothetical protein [Bacilli bacterium]